MLIEIYYAYISGTLVLRVRADDPDLGESGAVRYQFPEGSKTVSKKSAADLCDTRQYRTIHIYVYSVNVRRTKFRTGD